MWILNEIWKNEYGHLLHVVEVKPNGIALIEMIEPYKSGPHTQKLIPTTWSKYSTPRLKTRIKPIINSVDIQLAILRGCKPFSK